MDRRNLGRFVWVSVVAGALLAGAWVNASGAAVKAPTSYSESDCGVIQNIVVEDDSSNGAYWGETARNASKAYGAAAKKIEDKGLKKSMKTLADVWRRAGKAESVITAAKITTRFADRYGKALAVYTKATVACASQEITSSLDETTTTEPSSSDSE